MTKDLTSILLLISLFLLNVFGLVINGRAFETFPLLTIFFLVLYFIFNSKKLFNYFRDIKFLDYLLILYPLIFLFFSKDYIFWIRYITPIFLSYLCFLIISKINKKEILYSLYFILMFFYLISFLQMNPWGIEIFCALKTEISFLSILPRNICAHGLISVLSPEPSYHAYSLIFALFIFEFNFFKNLSLKFALFRILIILQFFICNSKFGLVFCSIYFLYNIALYTHIKMSKPLLFFFILTQLLIFLIFFFNYQKIEKKYSDKGYLVTTFLRMNYNFYTLKETNLLYANRSTDFQDKYISNVQDINNFDLDHIKKNRHFDYKNNIKRKTVFPSSSLIYAVFMMGYVGSLLYFIIFFSKLFFSSLRGRDLQILFLLTPYLLSCFFLQLNFANLTFWILFFLYTKD